MEDRLPSSSWPTLRQLQFLAALDQHGSFVRAAEAVGVTQPTLSAGVKELEAVLGVTLVERARSGAVLTPAGREATQRATGALAQVEDLVRAVRRAGAPLNGTFRLGAILAHLHSPDGMACSIRSIARRRAFTRLLPVRQATDTCHRLR